MFARPRNPNSPLYMKKNPQVTDDNNIDVKTAEDLIRVSNNIIDDIIPPFSPRQHESVKKKITRNIEKIPNISDNVKQSLFDTTNTVIQVLIDPQKYKNDTEKMQDAVNKIPNVIDKIYKSIKKNSKLVPPLPQNNKTKQLFYQHEKKADGPPPQRPKEWYAQINVPRDNKQHAQSQVLYNGVPVFDPNVLPIQIPFPKGVEVNNPQILHKYQLSEADAKNANSQGKTMRSPYNRDKVFQQYQAEAAAVNKSYEDQLAHIIEQRKLQGKTARSPFNREKALQQYQAEAAANRVGRPQPAKKKRGTKKKKKRVSKNRTISTLRKTNALLRKQTEQLLSLQRVTRANKSKYNRLSNKLNVYAKPKRKTAGRRKTSGKSRKRR